MKQRYRFITDLSDHWYYIQADRTDDWEEWCMSEEAQDGGSPPDWAVLVNMPLSWLTFEDPVEDR